MITFTCLEEVRKHDKIYLYKKYTLPEFTKELIC